MPRQAGTRMRGAWMTVYITEDLVLHFNDRNYMFSALLSPMIWNYCEKHRDTKLYYRYAKNAKRGLYNTRYYCGLQIIDIAEPHKMDASVELKIVVGQGETNCYSLDSMRMETRIA